MRYPGFTRQKYNGFFSSTYANAYFVLGEHACYSDGSSDGSSGESCESCVDGMTAPELQGEYQKRSEDCNEWGLD